MRSLCIRSWRLDRTVDQGQERRRLPDEEGDRDPHDHRGGGRDDHCGDGEHETRQPGHCEPPGAASGDEDLANEETGAGEHDPGRNDGSGGVRGDELRTERDTHDPRPQQVAEEAGDHREGDPGQRHALGP